MTKENILGDRTKYLGASDFGAIMGLNPHKSRMQLLLEKRGMKENTFSGNQYTRFGDEFEEFVVKTLKEKGSKITGSQEEVKAILNDFPICIHLDGRTEDTIIEIKSAGTKVFKEFEKDIPEYYMAQIQGQMYFKGFKKGKFIVGERTDDLTIGDVAYYDVELDMDFCERMVDDLTDFIRDIHKDTFESDDFERLLELKAQAKEIKDEIKELEDSFKKDKSVRFYETGYCFNRVGERTTVDNAKLKKDGIYEKYSKTSKTNTFVINEN